MFKKFSNKLAEKFCFEVNHHQFLLSCNFIGDLITTLFNVWKIKKNSE